MDPFAPPIDPMLMQDPTMLGQMPMPGPMDPALGGMPMMPPAGPMMPPIGGMPMGMMGGMPPLMPPPVAPAPGPMEMLSPVPPEPEPFVEPGPMLKPWYKKPPKPLLADVLEEADRERADHQGRIGLAMEGTRRLNNEVTGIFPKDKEDIEQKRRPRGRLTDLIDEHNAACSHIAAMDIAAIVPLKDSIDREESTAKEDLIHYLWECFERQHSRAGNASLKWALPDVTQKYGMLAASVVVDPMDDECGLRMQMVDPATVFPVFEGGMGLACVYRQYRSTAAGLLGSFYDAEGEVEEAITEIATFNGKYDPHYIGEVVEYWDRNWILVAFDGKEILCVEHDYARVPFVIKYAGFGQQAFTQTTRMYDDSGVEIRNWGSSHSDLRREDLMRIAQPFLMRRWEAHDNEEATQGLFLHILRLQSDPTWVLKLGLQTHNEGAPDIKQGERQKMVFRDDDDGQPVPPVITPDVANAVQMMHQQNKQTGMASGVIMGQMPGAQASGSAIDIFSQAGFEKWKPLVMIIEEFITEWAEFCMELLRDWGGILGMDDDHRGMVLVPRRNPNNRTGEAPAHEVTPKMLRTHGIRCKVELRRFNPSGLTNLANGLAILRNLGVIDKRSIIDLTGITNNPDAILDRIDEETLDEVPEVKQEKTLRMLYKLAKIAEQRGEYDNAREAMNRAYFIASQMQHRMMYGMPADPMTGLMPGMGAMPQVPLTNGMTMPGEDQNAQQGGRPPGSAAGSQYVPPQPGMGG
jgi:hypothetical protein